MNRAEKAALRQKVVDAVKGGASMDAAIEVSGFCFSYVRSILKAAGVPTPKSPSGVKAKQERYDRPDPDDRDVAMTAMFREGNTLEQIGAVHGISRERVRQRFSAIGVTASEGGQAVVAARRRQEKQARIEARCLLVYGCDLDGLQELKRNGVMRRFSSQKNNAAMRWIEWDLTPWQWWVVWRDSGKWSVRGRRAEEYVMCRHGDVGPYSVTNVFIATASENTSEMRRRITGRKAA